MATRYWDSSGSTDMNNPANYTGAGDLLTTDNLIFDSTGAVNAAATANLSVNSVTISSDFTNSWSISGRVLTVSDNLTVMGTGAVNFGSGITLNDSTASLIISTAAAVTLSSCVLTVNGSDCTLTNNKESLSYFKKFIVGNSCGLTINGTSSTGVTVGDTATVLTMGTSGRITAMGATFNLRPFAAQTVMSLGAGYTFDGTGPVGFLTGQAAVFSLPEFTYTGQGSVLLGVDGNNYGPATWNLAGDLNIGSNTLYLKAGAVTDRVLNINMNTYTITCGDLNMYSTVALPIMNVNFMSSNLSVSSLSTAAYNSGTPYLNMGPCVVDCSGNWTLSTKTIVTHQLDRINFIGDSTITSNGRSFCFVDVSGGSITMLDDMVCRGLAGEGNVNRNEKKLTVLGDQIAINTGTRFSPLSTEDLVGTDNTGTNNMFANYLVGSRFQATTNGVSTVFKIYSGGNGNAKSAIYADVAGEPGALLWADNSGITCVANEWNSVVAEGVAIKAGEYYYLMTNTGTNSVNRRLATGGPRRYKANQTYSSFTFPDPWGTDGTGDSYTCCYAVEGNPI